MAQPLTIEEYDTLLDRHIAGEVTWAEFRQRLEECGNYAEIIVELGRRYPPPPRNLTLTQEEQDDLITRYANGHITWSDLREYDEFEHYGDVIMELGRLNLRIPVAPLTGPNAELRKQGIRMLREALMRQERKNLWPATLAEVAALHNQGRDFHDMLQGFLNAFYHTLREDGDAYARIAAEPEPIENVALHVYIAAVAEHLALRWLGNTNAKGQLTKIPGWVNHPSRFLAEPWYTIGWFCPLRLIESPEGFRRHGIYTEAEPLRRALMPRLPLYLEPVWFWSHSFASIYLDQIFSNVRQDLLPASAGAQAI